MSRTLILFVEDEPAIAELVAWSLQQGGWDCCAVADVTAAWEFIRVRRPHLLVLERTVDVLRLRKAMRGARHLVKTVRNVGYVLSP